MPARSRTVLIIFLAAHLVNDFFSTALPAFLPAVAVEFDLDYTELGILSFAFGILLGVLQPVLGNVADRFGRRRWMLVAGFVVGAAGFLAMAAAPTFWFIVLVSLLCGLGGATYHPQATAYIVAAYPDRRGRMLGIHGWGGSGGHFLAPAVVVLTIAAFNWRVAMAVIAIPLLLTAVMMRVTLEETTPAPAARLRGALTRPLVVVAVAFGVINMVGRTFLTFFVKMLVDEGWAETTAGILLTVMLLAGIVAQPLGGWAFDRLGGRRVFSSVAAASAVLVGIFAVSGGALSLVAVAGLSFFGFSLFPVVMAQASQLVPSSQTGAATGVALGLSSLMTSVALPIVGALAEAVGDIRVALAWQLPLLLGAIALARKVPE